MSHDNTDRLIDELMAPDFSDLETNPHEGETRIISRFHLFPRKLGEWRWGRQEVQQVWGEHVSSGDLGGIVYHAWTDVCWADQAAKESQMA